MLQLFGLTDCVLFQGTSETYAYDAVQGIYGTHTYNISAKAYTPIVLACTGGGSYPEVAGDSVNDISQEWVGAVQGGSYKFIVVNKDITSITLYCTAYSPGTIAYSHCPVE